MTSGSNALQPARSRQALLRRRQVLAGGLVGFTRMAVPGRISMSMMKVWMFPSHKAM